jgi:sulfhydrogenase subunit gamma (sulfur reductase)
MVEPRDVYLPECARIIEVISENSQIKTFVLEFADADLNKTFSYEPGQFMMISVPHVGEAPISISSTPTRPGNIHLSVRRAGRLTAALHDLEAGATLGLRGPYGRPFPVKFLHGKDLLLVAGGIGLAPLRSLINYCLDNGRLFGTKTILYGSRLPSDIAFKTDLEVWSGRADVRCLLTVDAPEEGWDGPVGVVTILLDRVELDPKKSVALTCGPPIMIEHVLTELERMGFYDDNVITTMERHMKCGMGFCGHCHMGDKFVCTDGPIFTKAELARIGVPGL